MPKWYNRFYWLLLRTHPKQFKLTPRVLKMLQSKGYELICPKCQTPIHTYEKYESRPSKYPRWKCKSCDWKSRINPKKLRLHQLNDGGWICPRCGGKVICFGRKFYHASCFDEYHLDIKPEEGEEEELEETSAQI